MTCAQSTVTSIRAHDVLKVKLAQLEHLQGQIDVLKALPASLPVTSVSPASPNTAPLVEVKLCDNAMMGSHPPLPLSQLPAGLSFRGVPRHELPRASDDLLVMDVLADGLGCRWFTKFGGTVVEMRSLASSLSFEGCTPMKVGSSSLKAFCRPLLAPTLAPEKPVEPVMVYNCEAAALWSQLEQKLPQSLTRASSEVWRQLVVAYGSHGGIPPHVLARLRDTGLPDDTLAELLREVKKLPKNVAESQRLYVANVLASAETWLRRLFRGAAAKQRNAAEPTVLERLLKKEIHPELQIASLRPELRRKKGSISYQVTMSFRATARQVWVSSKPTTSVTEADTSFDWYRGTAQPA